MAKSYRRLLGPSPPFSPWGGARSRKSLVGLRRLVCVARTCGSEDMLDIHTTRFSNSAEWRNWQTLGI